MYRLNRDRWNNAWLSRPFEIQPVPGSAMIEINGVRGFLTPGDVAFLFHLATQLPASGNYLEVGSWMSLSSILAAGGQQTLRHAGRAITRGLCSP